MDFKIKRVTEKQVAQKGGSRGPKIWTPSFSHILAQNEPNEAKKSILTDKSYGMTYGITLCGQPVDGGDSERRHDNHTGITPAVKLVDELGGWVAQPVAPKRQQ